MRRGSTSSFSSTIQPPSGAAAHEHVGDERAHRLMREGEAGLRIERADLGDHALKALAVDAAERARALARSPAARRSRLASSVRIGGSRRFRSASCSARHSASERAKIPVGARSWQRRSTRSTACGVAPSCAASTCTRHGQVAGLVERRPAAPARSPARPARRRRPRRSCAPAARRGSRSPAASPRWPNSSGAAPPREDDARTWPASSGLGQGRSG